MKYAAIRSEVASDAYSNVVSSKWSKLKAKFLATNLLLISSDPVASQSCHISFSNSDLPRNVTSELYVLLDVYEPQCHLGGPVTKRFNTLVSDSCCVFLNEAHIMLPL
jgi:hypothetical protein